MRNLTQYPITLKEITDCLDQCSADINDDEIVGDMRPLLLRTASQILKRLQSVTHDIGYGL